jgi:hypothetical protein
VIDTTVTGVDEQVGWRADGDDVAEEEKFMRGDGIGDGSSVNDDMEMRLARLDVAPVVTVSVLGHTEVAPLLV